MNPGLNAISNEDYHADREYVSSSGLKMLLKDEREYFKKYILGEKEEDQSLALGLGTYIHSSILEPETIPELYAIYPGQVRRGKEWEKFKEENANKLIITNKDQITANSIVRNIEKNDLVKSFITNGKPEESYCGELLNLKVKMRADYITPKYILDVKTTSYNMTLDTLQRTVQYYDYDLSAALYLDIVAKNKSDVNEFYFLFVNTVNYDVTLARASHELIRNGRIKYQKAIEKYHRLQREGFFDQNELPNVILELGLPNNRGEENE